MRQVKTTSTPVAARGKRRSAMSLNDAAAMLVDDEADGDKSFEPSSGCEDSDTDSSASDSEWSASGSSVFSSPGKPSLSVTSTPRQALKSRGEPSSKGTTKTAEPPRKRGKPCTRPSTLSAKKSPGKFLSPGRSALSQKARGRSVSPARPASIATNGDDFLAKVSSYAPAMSSLPGLEQYASYPSPQPNGMFLLFQFFL